MTKHFNKTFLKERRRYLRKNQTEGENILWQYLRKRKTLGCKFRRQYSVDNYVIDFYCPELKFAIELDGEIHNIPEQREYDKKRQTDIEVYKIKFLRITNEEFLNNPNKTFEKIEEMINLLRNELNLTLNPSP